MATDYPVIGAPSIDVRTFQTVLTAAHSPAAGEAPAMYAAIRSYGVDPGVVLAIMQHESGFGKAGIAVGRNNGFGDRYYAGAAAFGATNRGGWAAFPTWAAGAAYTASLLASHGKQANGGTARTFPNWYAPSSDGNNPQAYGVAVVNAINSWRGDPKIAAAAARITPATPKAAPKAAPKAPAKAAGVTIGTGTALGIVGLAVILLAVLMIRR